MNPSERIAFSVVIPAHNEENYIGKCLKAAWAAAEAALPCRTEIIVVTNRCTDRTAEIAGEYGARVVPSEANCISGVRNAGVRAARGSIIVTVDADSCMSECALTEIRQMLRSGKYIGGGAAPVFDRMSPGILCSVLYVAWNLLPVMRREGAYLSGAMFWFRRRDFEAVGGFDETLVSLEDLDFARRMLRFGRTQQKGWGTLRKTKLITSSRKFDQFGDWYLIKNRELTKRIFTGRDREAADSFYYHTR